MTIGEFEDLEIDSIDISSTFRHGEVEEEIYMQQPEGFAKGDKSWVWHLIKSLYGLKQSSRCWQEKLNRDNLRLHFKLRDLDPVSWLLGVEVIRDHSACSLTLNQRQYTLETLQRYGFEDCNGVTMPMDPGIRLSKSMSPKTKAEAEEKVSVYWGYILG